MKNIKWSNIALALLYVAAGLLLICYPKATTNQICTIIGVSIIVIGILNIIRYFLFTLEQRIFRNDFLIGLLFVSIGCIALAFKTVFLQFVYIALALVIMYSGFVKIQDGIDSAHLGGKTASLYFILAAISVVLGLVVLFNSYIFTNVESQISLHRLIGVGLTYSGLSDLFSSLYLSSKLNAYIKYKLDNFKDDQQTKTPLEEVKQEEVISNVEEEKTSE